MIDNVTFICEKVDDDKRVDLVTLRHLKNRTRAYVQHAIDEGGCLVNGKKVKNSYRVKEGDTISFMHLEEKVLTVEKRDIPLDIIYEDEDLVVINKPRGLVVHPSNGHYDGNTLVNALLYHIKDLSSINGVIRPGIVHRIDKDTSGLLVVAKNDTTHLFLQEQLKDKTMHREYYALVEGVIPHTKIKIDAPLGKDKNDRLKRTIDVKEGKEAITYVEVLERYRNHSFISCRLETGRTHQIRVHLAYIHHPIVGDTTYGFKKQPYTSKGQMLHAYKLSFIHPRTKEKMEFFAPLDEEFIRVQNLLKNL